MIEAGVVVQGLRERFGRDAEAVARAPGRVNLIGEHTDYNDGFVMPIALDRGVTVAAARRTDRRCRLASLEMQGVVEFDLARLHRDPADAWGGYARGVAWALQEAGHPLCGLDAVLSSDVPVGAGLSSSAALEVALAFLWQEICGFEMPGPEMARLCQRAENEFVGVKCGIMDQFISRLGRVDHALLIDCRSLEFRYVPVPSDGVCFIVADTGKRRGLVDSEYNARRKECEAAVRFFASRRPGVLALRDVTPDELADAERDLSPVTFSRARHVVLENQRTLDAAMALERGEIEALGALMNASHESLRDEYAVSCPELDLMVDLARAVPGVLGSRLTGAGFGGCTVSLVEERSVPRFLSSVPPAYRARTGLEPALYACGAAAGASRIEGGPLP